MGLFSQSQLSEITAIAEKSRAVAEPAKQATKTKSINAELNRISAEVEKYFQDSTSILITSLSQLHDYVTELIATGYCAIDTETTGLDRIRDYIVGASLYYPGGVECYIPIKHKVPIFEAPYADQLTYEEVASEFQRIVDAQVKTVWANADYDFAMIYKDLKVDFMPTLYFDVIHAWRVIKEDEPKKDLKHLYNKYVLKGGGNPKRFSDFFPPALFIYCKPEIAKLYAANDAVITFKLFEWQLPYLLVDEPKCKKHHFEKLAELYWNIELPMLKICQSMHRRGIYLDKFGASMLHKKYVPGIASEKQALQEAIQKEIDAHPAVTAKRPFLNVVDFNPNSTPHVQWVVYDLLGLGADQKTRTTDKDVLSTFNHPVVKQILAYRSLVTLVSTFVEKLPNVVGPDHRIHCQFNSIGAACVVGDTILPTDSGYRTIEDICESAGCIEGQHIDVSDLTIINKDQEFELATSVIKYTNQPTIKITTEQGFVLEGTYNHPVMVSSFTADDNITLNSKQLSEFWDNRYFKPLEDVQIGDFIEIPCNFNPCPSTYVPTNLECGPRYQTSRTTAKFPEVYNEDFAEFLGMYHADGAAAFREGTYTISISNDNPDVIARVDALSMSLFNVATSHYTAQAHLHEVETYINCMQLKDMDRILSHGKRSKQIPAAIWRSPKSVINRYIRGLTLDSSVYLDENGRAAFELSIINELDARLVQYHLASQGILCYRSFNINKDNWKTPRLSFNADNYMLFRDTIGFVESSKYQDTQPCAKNKYCSRRVDNSFRVKVKSIEYGINTVYDLHVPGTHSFVSNGIISHNTGRMSSSSPNTQNIPSKHSDIRHMFRGSPSKEITLNCAEYDGHISLVLFKFSKLQRVSDNSSEWAETVELNVGDEVCMQMNDEIQTAHIESITPLDSDADMYRIVFDITPDVSFIWKAKVITATSVLISSDFSQQEPKILAVVCQDENLIKSFKEGKDIYSFIASIAFNTTYEACLENLPTGEYDEDGNEIKVYQPDGKARRSEAKTVVLGILYGRSIPSIADQLYSKEDWSDEKKVKQAQFVYDSVLEAFPALRAFMDGAQLMAHTHGYVETILGRRRHIPDMMLNDYDFEPLPGYVNPDVDPLNPATLAEAGGVPARVQAGLRKEFASYKYKGQIFKRIRQLKEDYHIKVVDNTYKKSEASRQCVNSIIQGSAAELTKMAMIKVEHDQEWQELLGQVEIPVHDELIGEVPIENYEAAGNRLSELMCAAASFMPFSIKCDVTTSFRWSGVEYPCKHKRPENLLDMEDDEIRWVQYYLVDTGYYLPVFKLPNGDKPRGEEAVGINGKDTEEFRSFISDYMNRYKLTTDKEFLWHIEHLVCTGELPDMEAFKKSKYHGGLST